MNKITANNKFRCMMLLLATLFFIGNPLSSCSGSNQDPQNASKDNNSNGENNNKKEENIGEIKYLIVEEQLKNPVRCVLSVGLEKKIPQSQLEMLATKIKEESDCVSDIVYIFFLLPEIQTDNGAWARVNFTPAIKVHFLAQV